MLNVGIVGIGNISTRVADGIKHAGNARLFGACSRNLKSVRNFMDEHNVHIGSDNIDEFLAIEEIDVIYICVPSPFHKVYIEKSLIAGKHVICEKPMVASKEELEYLFNLSKENNCFLMEAHKTVFTPLNAYIYDLVHNQGVIRDIISISAEYSTLSDTSDFSNHMLDNTIGGASYDIGVYPAAFCNFMANSAISGIHTNTITLEDKQFDHGYQSFITYQNGVTAMLNSSWLKDVKDKGTAYIIGTEGYFEIPAYWKGNKAKLHTADGNIKDITIDMKSDFTGEIEHAITCIENDQIESNIMNLKSSSQILIAIGKEQL